MNPQSIIKHLKNIISRNFANWFHLRSFRLSEKGSIPTGPASSWVPYVVNCGQHEQPDGIWFYSNRCGWHWVRCLVLVESARWAICNKVKFVSVPVLSQAFHDILSFTNQQHVLFQEFSVSSSLNFCTITAARKTFPGSCKIELSSN